MTAEITAGSPNVTVNGIAVARVGDLTDGESEAAVGSAISGALSNITQPLQFAGGAALSAANGVLQILSGNTNVVNFGSSSVGFSAPVNLPNTAPTSPTQAATKQYVDDATGSSISYPITVDKGGTGATNESDARTNIGLAVVANTGSYNDLSNKPTIPSGITNLSESANTTTVTIASDTGADAVITTANSTVAGVITAANQTKLDGIAAGAQVNVPTNITDSANSTTVTIISSTGTDAVITTANSTVAGVITAANQAKLDGIAVGGATNLSESANSTAVTIASDTGTDAVITTANSTVAGVITAANQSKLDGLATVASSGAYNDLTGQPATALVGTGAPSGTPPTGITTYIDLSTSNYYTWS